MPNQATQGSSTDILLGRLAELEHMLRRERHRTASARRERDKWRARAKALEPDATTHRRWLTSLEREIASGRR